MNHTWTCSCCGKQFNSLPLDFASRAPDHWFQIPDTERQNRAKLSDDVCIIDDRDIFIRGCLDIPIIGQNECFSWGVWVSVSKASFARIHELWDSPDVDDEPPKFGWLCNNIRVYPPTLGLKTNLHLRDSNRRPSIELEPTDHPLAVEQREGISIQRVEEIAARLSLRH